MDPRDTFLKIYSVVLRLLGLYNLALALVIAVNYGWLGEFKHDTKIPLLFSIGFGALATMIAVTRLTPRPIARPGRALHLLILIPFWTVAGIVFWIGGVLSIVALDLPEPSGGMMAAASILPIHALLSFVFWGGVVLCFWRPKAARPSEPERRGPHQAA